jgi:hypothetical protein
MASAPPLIKKRTSLASPPSMVVAAPREFITDQAQLMPGIRERVSYRCYVGFDTTTVPRITIPETSFSLLARREIAYALLSSINRIRRIFRPTSDTVPRTGSLRDGYQRLVANVAKHILLAQQLSDRYPLSRSLTDREDRIWFESSRRVVECETGTVLPDRPLGMICHVFALLRHQDTDRILNIFLTEAPFSERIWRYYDEPTDLLVECRRSRRVFSHFYCEVSIAPRDAFAEAESIIDLPSEDMTSAPAPVPSCQEPVVRDVMDSVMSDSRAEQDGERGHSPPIVADALGYEPLPTRQLIDEHAIDRAGDDLRLIVGQLHEAVARQRSLDDDQLVRNIAARRTRYARKHYIYPEGTANAPSRESSENIVRSVIELYKLGQIAASQDVDPPH